MRHRKGFTLIELLVVIAIIGVLIGLLLPAVQSAREAARRAQCTNHLKQIALAIHNFENAKQTLPSSRMGPQHASWFVQILPYMEQEPLYNSWNLVTTYYLQQTTARVTQVATFYCPTRRVPMLSTQFEVSSTGLPDTQEYPGSLGDYAANGGQYSGPIVDDPLCRGAICQADSREVDAGQLADSKSRTRMRDMRDGTSNTFLVGEKHVPQSKYGLSGFSWGDGAIFNGDFPRNYNRLAGFPRFSLGQGPYDLSGPWHCRFGSDHPGVCMFAFSDGHVAAVKSSTSMEILNKLAVRNDGQVIGDY